MEHSDHCCLVQSVSNSFRERLGLSGGASLGMPAHKKPVTACPLPIATTQLARGLLRLHSRLRGELAKVADDEELLVPSEAAGAAMAHIEALVGFLGVRFEPGSLKPIRTRPRIGPLGHGDLRAEAVADKADLATANARRVNDYRGTTST